MNEVFYLITNEMCLLGFNSNFISQIDKLALSNFFVLNIRGSAYKQKFLISYVFVFPSSMKSFCKLFQDIEIIHDDGYKRRIMR